MIRILTNLSSLFLFSFFAPSLLAQPVLKYWKTANIVNLQRYNLDEHDITPQKAYSFELDLRTLKKQIENAPLRFSSYDSNALPIISLPLPDASERKFKIVEAPVFHADLQRQFPDIRSYSGYDIENPSVTIRFDISPNGFSAMILGESNTIFIDPYSHQSNLFYNSYYKNDFLTDKSFLCQVENESNISPSEESRSLRTGDGMMRKYRLALACTGEYATYHGGTVAKVLAAMNKTMTRVNGVYEKEFSITMEIIPNNTSLIFLSSASDGYTNDSGSKMLGENQAKCDALIGTANYDIGHVFSTGGGGIASLQSPCKAGTKARGVTGSPKPTADPFDIDYVAHEMGHQFGGNHSFNNSCSGNIATSASYETGSGSTIMGYAGVCSPNVQSNSDAYFHAVNVAEINTYSVSGVGNGCAQKIQTSNLNAPIVNAGTDYTIPKETPFELDGRATDVESTATSLTYTWEQYDRESAAMPPTGNAAAGPLFRSITPTKSSVRVFPNLNNIVKNTKNTWEVLPKTPRSMNFRLTVRDNDVNGGRSTVDAMKITVADGDPFLVTHPDTSKITWIGGQNQTIKWNIGNTSISPINTPQVMVLLSTDGGYTYPDTLAQAIPNTGSAVVRVPETATTKARIKIKGVNNIFFDISNNDFTIQKPLFPTFIFSTATNEAKICQIQKDSVNFNLNVGSISNFKNQVDLSIKHLPNNAKVSFSQDTITPSGQVNITIYDLKKASAGVYDLFIHGKSGILVDSIPFKLSLFDEINTKVQTLRPSLFEKGFGVKTPFKWNKVQNADSYVIEISSNEKFQPIIETGISSDTQYIAKNLAQTQIYYWRIKAVNTCNESIVTSPIAFQTSALFCDTTSTDVAVSIPTTVADVSSKVEITRKGFLADIDVYTRIDHTSLSDLEVNLQNPNGEEITLFSGVCEDKNHADATFDDNGGVVTCSTGSVTLKGRFKPKESLSIYNNTNVRGNWVLLIKDRVAANGGTLKNWNIRVCTDITPDAGLIVETDTLIVKDGETKNIGEELIVSTSGSANQTPDKINYRIVALPKNGILKKGSTTLLVGSIISQQEINTGAFFYSHDKNSVELRDTFYFETTSAAGGWIPNSPFFVKIRKNNFKVGYTVIDSIKCFGGNEAKISINTIGGKTPLTYSLNGSSFQSDSVFQNLKAGKYEISVKDSEDFISIENFEIKQPLAISTSIPKDSSNILINISGGTSPYEINFDNKGFSTINSFPNQANGWHTFVIRDANGCEFKDSINLAVNTLKATITVKEPLCNGASNGAITVDAIGGRAPYDFQLNKSAFQDNGLFPNLFSGAYTITVKDADGFVRSFFVKVTEPASIVINTNQKQDTLVLNPIGGVAPFQYSINDGVTFQSSPIFPKTPNGNYTLVVKDANDCTAKKGFQFTAVKNIATEYGINISPNPTNDFINIQIKRVLDKNITVAVLNVEGRIVKQSNIATGQNVLTMDIKDLNVGTYYVVLKNADFEFSSKILVIK